MVGVASETLALELRDTIVENLGENLNPQERRNLDVWTIKTVLDEIKRVLDNENMERKLKERYEANWAAFVHKIRMSRNDAGHPASIETVTEETAHSALLIFPELAKLIEDIKEWICNRQ